VTPGSPDGAVGARTDEAGFSPPPYPYDRLDALRAAAEERFGTEGGTVDRAGVVDCSIGTPYDPPASAVLAAMATSDTERGYPLSAGSSDFRRAAADWISRRFGVVLDPREQVAACVGTKEFVASAAQYLRLRHPGRDTVLYPAVSYPTYAMGATLGGCRPVAVRELPGGGPDLASVAPADAERALMLWINSPSNPTGQLTDMDAVARWGRALGIPVFSDECYAEFTWDGPPRSILGAGTDGVVAVHSLSKRSNLAGARAGFYAGDPDLVGYLLDVRRHAGLMIPGPVQAGAVVALDDDDHVIDQRQRYQDRLRFFAGVLAASGHPTPLPAGGFYLWAPAPEVPVGGSWGLAEALALAAGVMVSPGDLYGPDGSGFVRVAMVQPIDRLQVVADRLAGPVPAR
jgi:aspartate/methionine/tyrosine aminotransferase